MFKADVSLTPFPSLSDSVIVAGRTPSNMRLMFPKKKKEEEATPVRIARLNGSVAEWMSRWVRDSVGPAMSSQM